MYISWLSEDVGPLIHDKTSLGRSVEHFYILKFISESAPFIKLIMSGGPRTILCYSTFGNKIRLSSDEHKNDAFSFQLVYYNSQKENKKLDGNTAGLSDRGIKERKEHERYR